MHRESQSLCARLSLASSSVEILIKANLLYFPTLPYLLSPFPDLADSGGAVGSLVVPQVGAIWDSRPGAPGPAAYEVQTSRPSLPSRGSWWMPMLLFPC